MRHSSSLMLVVCCVGSGHYDELIVCSEESYFVRLRACVCVRACAYVRVRTCVRDMETSAVVQPRPACGCCFTEKEMTVQTLFSE